MKGKLGLVNLEKINKNTHAYLMPTDKHKVFFIKSIESNFSGEC